MPFAANGTVRIYWKSDGSPDKPALLMAHALGADLHLWEPLMQRLVQDFWVLRFDLRGHGASDVPAGEYTMDELGQDALAVADAAGARRFSYLGVSIGGMIGLWLGQHAGPRLERLAVCNTGAKMSAELWTERIAQLRRDGLAAMVPGILQRWFTDDHRSRGDPRIDSVRSSLLGTDANGYAGCAAAIRDMDLRPGLARIATPTLVMVGRQDASTPRLSADALAQAIPGAELAELQGAHIPFYEMRGLFLQTLLPFLTAKPQA